MMNMLNNGMPSLYAQKARALARAFLSFISLSFIVR
jgi:hypothetical protein